MPRGNGTGPQGMGPMTGRAAGYCAGSNGPGFANFAGGGGFGCGRGRGGAGRGLGRGFRGGYPAAMPLAGATGMTPEEARERQAAALRAQSEQLAAQLDGVNRRLAELSGLSPA